MISKGFHIKIISLLLTLLIWSGTGALWAQQPDSIPQPQPETTIPVAGNLVKQAAKAIQTDSLKIDSASIVAITDSLLGKIIPRPTNQFRPEPIRAMWLALVMPGGGQIYNRKYWKLPIVYGGFLGCAYALTWNNMMLRDYSQAYLDIMDSDPNTKSYEKMLPMGYSIVGKEARFQEIFKKKKNYFRKYRDMSIFAFAGVYLISVIDAYVDAELSSFDISEDLSFRIEPGFIETERTSSHHHKTIPALQCRLNF